MRVLLVGSRILPFRHGGDKNFWLDVLQGLRARGHEVRIISVTVEKDIRQTELPFRYVQPIPVYLDASRSRFNLENLHLAGTNNYLSKTLSLPRIIREIRSIRTEFAPDVVHFADNYGPALLAARAGSDGVPISISAPTYQADRPLYDFFLRLSLLPFDAVVPFSDAFAARLVQLGLRPESIRTIRWGVDTARFQPPSVDARSEARQTLGIPPDAFVPFWTGFLQQTGEEDFAFGVTAARLLLRDGTHAVPLFCFKAEHFRPERLRNAQRGVQIHGTAEAFRAALKAADLLVSPVVSMASTAAPPLVWLEAMSMGIPILTTPIPGASEAVSPGRSGLLVRSPAEAAEAMRALAKDPDRMATLRAGARSIVLERFSIEHAVGGYEALWAELARPRSERS